MSSSPPPAGTQKPPHNDVNIEDLDIDGQAPGHETAMPPPKDGPMDIETVQEQVAANTIQTSKWLNIALFVSLPIFWLCLIAINRAAVTFPVVFLPTVIALAVWKLTHRDQNITFWALFTAYFKGFYYMGIAVGIFRFIVLLIAVTLVGSVTTDGQYYFIVFLYGVFGVAWPAEYAKYLIAKNGRRDRPDLTDVRAYMWYSMFGALGYSTFLVTVEVFLLYSDNFYPIGSIFVVLLIEMCLELPLDLLTGYGIGVGVAKNEVFNWKLSAIRIYGAAWLIKILAAVCFWIIADYSVIATFVLYVLLVALTLAFVLFQSRNLPSSFVALPNEDLDNATAESAGPGPTFAVSDEDP